MLNIFFERRAWAVRSHGATIIPLVAAAIFGRGFRTSAQAAVVGIGYDFFSRSVIKKLPEIWDKRLVVDASGTMICKESEGELLG